MGKGFFAVEVNGKIYYTRDGHFLLGKNGYLVNQNGYPVLGEDGKIYIGRTSLSSVRITEEGDIFVGTNKVGKLKIVDLEGVKHLKDNLYTGKPKKAENYALAQGYLEGSNVNPVDEMVKMIETVRAYETYANSIKAVDENNSKLINEILKA
jgi:flagellar basal-body rod protein FlgF